MAGERKVISDVGTLRAFAHPLRQRLLNLLDEPRTVKELASSLGKPPDRLYYHLDLLEQHGLVEAIVERGAERRYDIVAQQIEVDPTLTMPQGLIDDLLGSILARVQEGFAAAARRGVRTGDRNQMLGVHRVVVTEAERQRLMKALDALVKKYEQPAGDGRRAYELVLGLWPSAEKDGDEEA